MVRQRSTPASPEASVDVQRAVLDAALDIIATDGVEAVSMREVARRSGVSHQAPYHYYGDRAGIFAAISEEGFRQFTGSFRAALALPGDVAANCFQSYVSFAIEHRGHYRVMFRADICGIHTHEKTMQAADEAFLTLLDLADAVDPNRNAADALTLPIALWSQAHGLATLLIDGPLLHKLPPETNVADVIAKVATLSSWSHNENKS